MRAFLYRKCDRMCGNSQPFEIALPDFKPLLEPIFQKRPKMNMDWEALIAELPFEKTLEG